MKLFFISLVLSVACAQYAHPSSGASSWKAKEIPAKHTTSWKGPIADHQIGVLPVDTPAVAAAKADHIKAQRELLAVLPQLPADELNRKDGLSEAAVLALQKKGHDELNQNNAAQIALALPKIADIPLKRWKGPIADHQLGVLPVDTPAVAAAKADIAKAHQNILAVLPSLPAEESYVKEKLSFSDVISLQQEGYEALNRAKLALAAFSASEIPSRPWTGPIADHQLGQLPKDTLEVAAAKADHLRARQEFLAKLPTLSAEENYQQQGLFNIGQISPVAFIANTKSPSSQQGISGTTVWTGATADHQLGVLPVDTPAVANAKADHLKAQRELLSVLPQLPANERYIQNGLTLQEVFALQQEGHDRLNQLNAAQIALAALELPTQRWTGPFAHHELGQLPKETAEVAAAKADHLRAYQHLLTVLPSIKEHQNAGQFRNTPTFLVDLGSSTHGSGLNSASQRWTGPIANHKIGVLPVDTPAVVAAKADHIHAQREFLAKLPVLPSEERYIKKGLDLPAVLTLQKKGQDELNRAQLALASAEANSAPIKPWTGPIAKHQLGVHPGDTPEVAAAKADHLKAYREALETLPQLPATEKQSELQLQYSIYRR